MKIFAHRGSSLIWPENTIFAFRSAHDAGAVGFETDLHLSRDHEIILSHDDNLARFGWPDKTVSQLDRNKVEGIEISSPDGRYRDKIITLRTLLETFPDKEYILDCKIDKRLLFEKLRDLLHELRFHSGIWFLTWSRRGDAYVREFFDGYPMFPRFSRTKTWGFASILGLGRIFEPSNRIVSLPPYHAGRAIFSTKQISSLARRGKTFMGYLVNSRDEFKRCQACGVQICLTDRPDLLSKFISAEGQETTGAPQS